jgi:5-formyltetrahydrofolate cyclo-ligase
MPLTKQLLRDRLLTERQAIPAAERTLRSQAIVERVCATDFFQKAGHIAAYLPILGEVDVMPILAVAAQAHKRVYLPRLRDDGRLDFAVYDPAMLVRGPRGVMQPAPELPSVEHAVLELVVVPGLGFDKRRHRLGLGAGFYDKTFGGESRRPTLLGVAYDIQIVDEVPVDPWDVPLDGVVSESAIL